MNLDTLYSLANLDLTSEPLVLVVPPMKESVGGSCKCSMRGTTCQPREQSRLAERV